MRKSFTISPALTSVPLLKEPDQPDSELLFLQYVFGEHYYTHPMSYPLDCTAFS